MTWFLRTRFLYFFDGILSQIMLNEVRKLTGKFAKNDIC